jgi:ABC-2 type transport system permease protein
MNSFYLSIFALWRREIIRFVRQRSRLIGAFAQPLVFWLLLAEDLVRLFGPRNTRRKWIP